MGWDGMVVVEELALWPCNSIQFQLSDNDSEMNNFHPVEAKSKSIGSIEKLEVGGGRRNSNFCKADCGDSQTYWTGSGNMRTELQQK